MANNENLVPFNNRSVSEARENGAKGGLVSGQSRRDKKYIQEALQKALNGKYEVGESGKKLGGYEALAISIINEAIKGNVQAFKEIRDTIGEKPKEQLEVESNDIVGIKINFVDKSKASNKEETDPKIIGEYTPPSNVEE